MSGTFWGKLANRITGLKINKKILALLLAVAFAVSLIPLVATAFYSVPVADDYNFGYYTHKAVSENNSFFLGILEANNHFFNKWQGFYTFNFLAAAQPFNINLDLYFVSNLSVLFIFIFSAFYFLSTVLRKMMHFNVWDYLLVSIPIVTVLLQFLPSIAEGIYWMDGSLSTVVEALGLLIISFVFRHQLSENKSRRIEYFILAVVFMIINSGVTTSFLKMMLVFIPFLIYSISKKYNNKALLITLMAISLAGFIIAITAPGNAFRMDELEGTRMSLLSAIIYAVVYSVVYLDKFITIPVIAVLVLSSVIFYNYAKRSKFKFNKPVLVFLYSYFVYAACMSVQLYAGGYLGAPRQMNMYYGVFLCMLFTSVLYAVGWLSKKDVMKKLIDVKKYPKDERKISLLLIVVVAFSFGIGCFQYNLKDVASISTAYSLLKEETQQYSKEMHNRIELYENSAGKDVNVEPLTVHPKCFIQDEPISTDPNYWQNKSVSKYYNLKSVKLSQ